MPVSGIVITFSSDVADHGETVEQLSAKPTIEVGQGCGAKLAVVVDSDSRQQDRQIWDWVRNLPGVEWVDVAFVGFDPSEEKTGRDISR